MAEIWRPIHGYDGLYEVSNLGRVKSLVWQPHRFLKLTKFKIGYSYVTLFKDGIRTKQLVHRLVATAFIPNPLNVSDVNHKDTNKLNNRLSNLEWVTRKQNSIHARDNGLYRPPSKKGEKHGMHKLTEAQAIEIKSLLTKMLHKDIAKKFNVSKGCIKNISIGKSWNWLP